MRVVLVAVALTLCMGPAAHACSCIPPGDPRQELTDAEAAVFGEVVGLRHEQNRRRVRGKTFIGPGHVHARLRVVRDYKGNLGRRVRITTSDQSSACGVSLRRGQRIGLLLHRADGRWSASSCTVRSRRHLDAGLEPLPEPTGIGAARFILAGDFGPPRVASLDAEAAVLGYGAGPGTATAIAACPGGTAIVEAVDGLRGRRPGLAVRDLATLQQTGARVPKVPPRSLPGAPVCLSEDGSRAALFVFSYSGRDRIVGFDGAAQRVIWEGRSPSAVFAAAAGVAYLGGPGGVRAVDLGTGTETPVGDLGRRAGVLALSPDGTTLAVAAGKRFLLLDVTTGEVVAERRAFTFFAAWITDDRIAVGDYTRAAIVDRSAQVVARIPAPSYAFGSVPSPGFTATGDGRLAIRRERQLLFVDGDGTQVATAPLFTQVGSLAALPAAAPAVRSAAVRCARLLRYWSR